MKKSTPIIFLLLLLFPILACGSKGTTPSAPNKIEQLATQAGQIQITVEAAATSVANIEAVATQAISLQTTVVALATTAAEQGIDTKTIEANIPQIGIDGSGNLTITFSDENLTAYISEGIELKSENGTSSNLQNPSMTINNEYVQMNGELLDPAGTLLLRFLPKVENGATQIEIITASVNDNNLPSQITSQIEYSIAQIFTQLEQNLPTGIQLAAIELDNGRLTLILEFN